MFTIYRQLLFFFKKKTVRLSSALAVAAVRSEKNDKKRFQIVICAGLKDE
jgi:hypothetical protein